MCLKMLHTRFCAVKTNDARFCKERQKETPYRLTRYGVLWTRRESNPRPFGCEPNALPTELRAHEKAPNFEWGQMSYNTRSGMQRLHSQLSYRPIFVFQNENSVTLLEGFVKDFSPGRPAGNGRLNRTRRFLKNDRSFSKNNSGSQRKSVLQ